MLFKISLKNIKSSIKDYLIYFFTLVIGVAIFYVFNSLGNQTVMSQVSKSQYDILDLMNSALSGISVFIAFVLGCLIIYASMFLIKRRKKEFGVYLTLGMSKRKVSLILFIETLLIGILSLVIGIIVGVCFSQLMSVLVINMFEADMSAFEFSFSTAACTKTIIYFAIMYVIVMIFNTFVVGKCKLIDLLYGGRKNEKVKMKNLWLCSVVFVTSASALAYAYYMVNVKFMEKMNNPNLISIAILIGIVATFTLFWSLSGFVLRIAMFMKKTYFKGLNSFSLRQISSKINTNIVSISIICILLFFTICILSTANSLKDEANEGYKKYITADAQVKKYFDDEYDEDYNEKQLATKRLTIDAIYQIKGIDVEECFKDYVHFYTYKDENFTFFKTFGNSEKEIKEKYPMISVDRPEQVMTISDYNALAKLYGQETYSLNDDEYIVIGNYEYLVDMRNIPLKNGEQITVFGKTLTPKYDKCVGENIDLAAQPMNSGTFIVPDSVVNEQSIISESIVGKYNTENKEEILKLDEKLKSIDDISENYVVPFVSTATEFKDSSVGIGVMITFIGLYLGITFLIVSAAILALKELSESADNVERYSMIRKIGADEKMINSALLKQIGTVFAAPLILACIHSIFGIKFCELILKSLGFNNTIGGILSAALVLVIIYGGYFVLTYISSKNIIKERM